MKGITQWQTNILNVTYFIVRINIFFLHLLFFFFFSGVCVLLFFFTYSDQVLSVISNANSWPMFVIWSEMKWIYWISYAIIAFNANGKYIFYLLSRSSSSSSLNYVHTQKAVRIVALDQWNWSSWLTALSHTNSTLIF